MKIICQNKKASFDYFLEDAYEAGIKLTGTEIKSIRLGKVNINDSYVLIRGNQVFIINMFIAKYEQGNIFNHQERRNRELLLHKKEIRKLDSLVTREGVTLIPTKLYFVDSLVKLEFCIAKGKKNYDKRQAIKEKDLKRDMAVKFKERY